MTESRGEKNPGGPSLAAETSPGSDSAERLPARIERYSRAKSRATEMRDYLRSIDSRVLAGKLAGCGNWLRFRHYYTVDKVRLAQARFCRKHLLCPLCAIRRGSKQLKAYIDRFEAIKALNGPLKAALVTLTVKNGPDLAERFQHLADALKVLNRRRRNSKGGNGGSFSEWSKVLGFVGTFEVTRNQESHEWHPHCHIIVLHDFNQEINEGYLAFEWLQITKDSFILDVTPLHNPEEPASDFVEVFKYACKFSELSLSDNWEAFTFLHGKRLVFSGGLFRGVDVPESLLDEPLDNLPYISLFYTYLHGAGYNLATPPNNSNPARA